MNVYHLEKKSNTEYIAITYLLHTDEIRITFWALIMVISLFACQEKGSVSYTKDCRSIGEFGEV